MTTRIAGAAILILFSRLAHASTLAADSIILSTISAQSYSDGVDVSSSIHVTPDRRLIVQGEPGSITSQSSFTAASFWGDGSHLDGVNSLESNIVWSGSAAFTSGFIIQSNGREISLSSGVATKNLGISAAGITTFFPELHNSASAIISDYSSTAVGCGPCVPGSTLTITTNGGSVEVVFSGAIKNISSGNVKMNFLQDGQFVGNLSNSVVIRRLHLNNMLSAGTDFRYLIPTPAAQSHSYCLSICTGTGGLTGELLNDNTDSNIFFVKELK